MLSLKRCRKTVLSLLTLTAAFMGVNLPAADQNLIKDYLKIVYPTSEKVASMTDEQASDFYRSLNFWYRVPMTGFETGIFDKSLTPQYHVFLFPDTCMRVETANDKNIRDGFVEDKVIEGSNKRYIEVSSFGWMMFPYGAYFNWAKGSGIYLDTGGKTISGYNKVTVVYKVYKQENRLAEFYKELADTDAVKNQILGSTNDLTEDQYNLLTKKGVKPEDWTVIPSSGAPHPYKPLVACMMYDNNWEQIQAELIDAKTPDKAYKLLVRLYVKDHNGGNYDQSKPRFEYLVGESNADIDAWMYDVVKGAGYNVIQMTLEPNSAGSPTFELCDVRWPKVSIPGKTPSQLGQEAIQGLQSYNLKFIWEKVIKLGWLQVRDPFDLMNDKKAFNIKCKYPKNSKIDDKLITDPPKDFPESWLPKNGWGVKQAKKDGYISTDSFVKWLESTPAPKPLQLPEKDNKGSFIKFGLNDVGNGGFSATNIKYNIGLLKKKSE